MEIGFSEQYGVSLIIVRDTGAVTAADVADFAEEAGAVFEDMFVIDYGSGVQLCSGEQLRRLFG
jgi:hypothetical protein